MVIKKKMKKEIKQNLFKKTCVLVLAVLMLTACSPQKVEEKAPSSKAEISSKEEISSTEPVVEKLPPQNPLTGETMENENLLFSRPVAVMINNIQPALPQRGINDCDVLYEMPVEGGVTRLMALYSDYKALPTIGSIRSARHDYVELVKPIDALYVHIGHSVSGKEAIEKNKINDLEGIEYANLAFFKDEKRAQNRSSEHCWYTKADLVQKGIEKIGTNMTLENSNEPLFNFAKPNEEVKYPDETAANLLNLTVSPGVKVSLTYNKEKGSYEQKEYGQNHIDENSNETFSCKNVFLMYTDVGMMPDNYHREIDLSKGNGYYVSNGKAVKCTFKKPTVDDKITVYTSDLNELVVNAGNSYFAIIPKTEEGNLTMSAE